MPAGAFEVGFPRPNDRTTSLRTYRRGRMGYPNLSSKRIGRGLWTSSFTAYELLYERPLAPKADYLAIPVYEFQVELRSSSSAGPRGTCRVVAAANGTSRR